MNIDAELRKLQKVFIKFIKVLKSLFVYCVTFDIANKLFNRCEKTLKNNKITLVSTFEIWMRWEKLTAQNHITFAVYLFR